MIDQERRRQLPCPEGRVPDQPAQKREVRHHALDLGLGECLGELLEGLRPVLPVRDQLRDHRVVGGADPVSLGDTGVDADTGGEPEPFDHTGLREEGARILRVQAGLDGVAAALGAVRVEPVAVRHIELETDEVDAVGLLGHRVLDLDPAVQLQEVHVVAGDEELDRAGFA